MDFNPRPPWGGRRQRVRHVNTQDCNFNPRPPWGGRPSCRRESAVGRAISIHALRGEGDAELYGCTGTPNEFQSTPSVGRATALGDNQERTGEISIHALRGEGDDGNAVEHIEKNHISIHALRGEGDMNGVTP